MVHFCINCNRPDAARTGDNFVCKTCGYKWDVAHEQANAAYLVIQGREPAEPMPVDEGDAEAPHGVREFTPDVARDLLNQTTVPELQKWAKDHGIDLGDVTRKAEIIDLLIESGELRPVYAPDGTILTVE